MFLQNFDYFDQYRKAFENPERQDYQEWLYNTFYSDANMELIQKGLQEKVYEKSQKKYIIGAQKKEHLIQIMEGIYKDYCQHLPYNLKQQIFDLNQKVIEFCYPYVINNAKAYLEYQDFAIAPLRPPPLPQSVSTTGQRTLPSMFIV